MASAVSSPVNPLPPATKPFASPSSSPSTPWTCAVGEHNKENVPPRGSSGPVTPTKKAKVILLAGQIGKSPTRGPKMSKNRNRRAAFSSMLNNSYSASYVNHIDDQFCMTRFDERESDRRAKELTESPLADVSQAYSSPLSLFQSDTSF